MHHTTESDTESDSETNTESNTDRHARIIAKALRTKAFATLATVSAKGRPHSAGVVYDLVDGDLWVHTMRDGHKATNIAHNPHVGITVPYRRLPVGPPYTLHFQAQAEIVALDDATALAHHDAGRLDRIAGHGAMEMEGACFVRIAPHGTIHSFGAGVPVLDLIRDPLGSGARSALAADVLARA